MGVILRCLLWVKKCNAKYALLIFNDFYSGNTTGLKRKLLCLWNQMEAGKNASSKSKEKEIRKRIRKRKDRQRIWNLMLVLEMKTILL